MQTYSKSGFVAMQVEFRDTTPPGQVPYLFYLLRKKLADLRPELPTGLVGPNVDDEYGDVNSVMYALTGDGADFAQLKKAAEALRQRLIPSPTPSRSISTASRTRRSSSSSAMPGWRRSASRPRLSSIRWRGRTPWFRPA